MNAATAKGDKACDIPETSRTMLQLLNMHVGVSGWLMPLFPDVTEPIVDWVPETRRGSEMPRESHNLAGLP